MWSGTWFLGCDACSRVMTVVRKIWGLPVRDAAWQGLGVPPRLWRGALEPGLVGLGSPLNCCHLHFTFSIAVYCEWSYINGWSQWSIRMLFGSLLIPHRVSGAWAFLSHLNDVTSESVNLWSLNALSKPLDSITIVDIEICRRVQFRILCHEMNILLMRLCIKTNSSNW
jgi:hypothetical protein